MTGSGFKLVPGHWQRTHDFLRYPYRKSVDVREKMIIIRTIIFY